MCVSKRLCARFSTVQTVHRAGVRPLVCTAPEEQTVVMHFTNDTVAPLSLHGAAMLAVTVLLIARLYGYDGLLHHPAMAPLDFPTAEDIQPR